MVTTNKMKWQALQERCIRRRRSRKGIFFVCVSVDFLIHSERYANTRMAVLIRRATCKSFFFLSFGGQRKVLSCEILPPRTSTLFLSRRSACPFLNCDQVSNRLTKFSGNLKLSIYTLCSRKVR